MDNEAKLLNEQAVEIEDWFKSERFAHLKRHYNAKDVASLRPSIPLVTPSHYLSRKLYNMLRANFNNKSSTRTFGALDTVQAINMCKYLSSIYISGWQCSSTHVPHSHEPGPDFADYPSSTVPDKVQQIVKA